MDEDSELIKIKTLHPEGDLQIVHGYKDGGFRISGHYYSGSVLVSRRSSILWSPPEPDKLTKDILIQAFPGDIPSLLLLGLGAAPKHPFQELSKSFKDQGIAVELMSTPAACRTWNVLITEGRDAVAALYTVG